MTNESKRNWNNLLTAKDFWKEDRSELGVLTIRSVCATEAAHIANEIIRKELEKAPRVRLRNVWGDMVWEEDKTIGIIDAKTATLIQIEELKRD